MSDTRKSAAGGGQKFSSRRYELWWLALDLVRKPLGQGIKPESRPSTAREICSFNREHPTAPFRLPGIDSADATGWGGQRNNPEASSSQTADAQDLAS